MDTNRDGLLHPDEVPEAIKPYVERVGRRAGAESFAGPWRLYGLEKRLRYLAHSARQKKLGEAAADDAEPALSAAREITTPTGVEKQYADRNTARTKARNLLNLYDENGDEVLEQKEWIRLSDDWRRVDRNRDGKLTSEEMADRMVWYGRAATRWPGNVKTETSTSLNLPADVGQPKLERPKPYSIDVRRLPEGLPGWFLQKDANSDGQIQMSEFAQTWTESKVAEFRRYDVNNDGIVTPQECVTTAESTGEGY
jgi:Ca2+-binding EF-hand superfamily protein